MVILLFVATAFVCCVLCLLKLEVIYSSAISLRKHKFFEVLCVWEKQNSFVGAAAGPRICGLHPPIIDTAFIKASFSHMINITVVLSIIAQQMGTQGAASSKLGSWARLRGGAKAEGPRAAATPRTCARRAERGVAGTTAVRQMTTGRQERQEPVGVKTGVEVWWDREGGWWLGTAECAPEGRGTATRGAAGATDEGSAAGRGHWGK